MNQNLEDKLLKIVDKCETEKNSLTRDVASLTQKLVEARAKIHRLQDENVCGFANAYLLMLHSWNKTDMGLFVLQERYRNDVNLAIQLLQCKPANFVSHKFDMVNTNVLFS